ncbi:hypothetical protein ACYOEI_37955 [Singulisphaera rosea]
MAENEHPRVLVACMAKSGSTYVARVLATYLGVNQPDPIGYWGRREQNLHPWHFENTLSGAYVLQMHIKPFDIHVDLFMRYGLRIALLRRNLADVVISLDDHCLNEGVLIPICYVDNREDYAAMPADDRYRYLIRHGLPWYISFYLSWRDEKRLPIVSGRYEDMVETPYLYFSEMISGLGFPVDPPRLADILSRSLPTTRFNKGVIGRSEALLSPRNKLLIEELLTDHPQDLSELLDDLPWHQRRQEPSRAIEAQAAHATA